MLVEAGVCGATWHILVVSRDWQEAELWQETKPGFGPHPSSPSLSVITLAPKTELVPLAGDHKPEGTFYVQPRFPLRLRSSYCCSVITSALGKNLVKCPHAGVCFHSEGIREGPDIT